MTQSRYTFGKKTQYPNVAAMTIYKPKSRTHLKLVYDAEKPKVEKKEPILRRPKNADVRPREHLRPDEVDKVIAAAKSVGRNRDRDSLLLFMMFRHGLRVSEAINLRWSDIDWDDKNIYVRRLKRGKASTQPIYDDEMKLLRAFRKKTKSKSPCIFMGERGTPISDDTVRVIIKRAGEIAGFDFPLHPHMLRHSCGYALAAKATDTRRIQDYLGHKNINHTVHYTQLAPNRFDGLWD